MYLFCYVSRRDTRVVVEVTFYLKVLNLHLSVLSSGSFNLLLISGRLLNSPHFFLYNQTQLFKEFFKCFIHTSGPLVPVSLAAQILCAAF